MLTKEKFAQRAVFNENLISIALPKKNRREKLHTCP